MESEVVQTEEPKLRWCEWCGDERREINWSGTLGKWVCLDCYFQATALVQGVEAAREQFGK